jgi:hypothetical protein
MGSTSSTDRRSFLKSSALVAAPIAAVATPAAAFADDGGAARLARLEDERAIEAAHRAFLKAGGAGALRGAAAKGETIRRIEPDHAADPGTVEFADDGRRATARHNCVAQIARDYDGETTIEQMARLQGNAADIRSKRCVVLAHYRKEQGQWMLSSAELA